MGELEKKDIYACALSMPAPEDPICSEWIEEISRHVKRNKNDEVFLVGHSLGVPAILRYLESAEDVTLAGCVLVSGPCRPTDNSKVNRFLESSFDFKLLKSKARKWAVIHGDNDSLVPLEDAQILSKGLSARLVVISNGGHLNGSSGWNSLSECLDALMGMMN